MSVDWRLRKSATNEYEDDLIDVTVVDTFNRFARKATAVIDDPDGVKRAAYPRATPVELEVARDTDPGYTRRFGGFVVNPKTDDNHTKLELLSHDFWLRKPLVFRTFNNEPIESVLKSLLTTMTPLVWEPSKLSIVKSDALITRTWKGERLDVVIDEIAGASANEEFGATNDAEFFFREREVSAAGRNFVPGGYYEAEFEDDGKQEVNRVTVYYGEGPDTAFATVEDRESQRRLQEELNAPRPVEIEVTKTYPEIKTHGAARRKAEQLQRERTTIQTGTIETWEAFDVSPGDVTRVEVPDQSIDSDFRVARIEYNWRDDQTVIDLAEHQEGVTDVLVNLSGEITRVDNRAADPNAVGREVAAFDLPFEVETRLKVYETRIEDQFSFGVWHGGFGHPGVNGGRLGFQRRERSKIIDTET